MTQQHTDRPAAIADVMALSAIVWVAAATLHEGMGHGLACWAMGGVPTAWSTFHFECGRQAMSIAKWRVVTGAGTMVNIGLMALGWVWWRRADTAGGRLTAWSMFVVNGLTSFGYLIFSAAFGIGDWNAAGVMAGVADASLARVVLAVFGIAGYYTIVRASAKMLSQILNGPSIVVDARRLSVTIWATTGIVSLVAALAAGAGWRSTLGASIGVALGGNAGLLSIARFMVPSATSRMLLMGYNWPLRGAAIIVVAAFTAILGPGVSL